MPYTQEQHQDLQLRRWCRYLGYSDFDTYLASGGSAIEALSVLKNLHDSIGMAIEAVGRQRPVINPHTVPIIEREPDLTDIALSAKRELPEEPVDAGNAHVQGSDAA